MAQLKNKDHGTSRKVEMEQKVNDICGKYRKRGRPRSSKLVKKTTKETSVTRNEDKADNTTPPTPKKVKRGRPKLSGNCFSSRN